MDEPILRYETQEQGRIAVITLNRPEQRNALSTELREAIYDAWERFYADDEAFVAVVTGAGKAFCAGADLLERQEVAEGKRERMEPKDRHWTYPLSEGLGLWKPTIAAVNGYAIAGGFNLALQCDIRIAATDAEFGIAETRWNRTTTWLHHLNRHMHLTHAMEIACWGDRRVSAQRAYEMGFVNRVVPPEDLMAEAMAWAERMLWLAPRAVRNFKQTLHRTRLMSTEDAKAFTDALQRDQRGMSDTLEGTRAFREKRRPEFRNQ